MFILKINATLIFICSFLYLWEKSKDFKPLIMPHNIIWDWAYFYAKYVNCYVPLIGIIIIWARDIVNLF